MRLATLFVAALLLTAGCITGGGGDSDAPTDEGPSNNETDDGTDDDPDTPGADGDNNTTAEPINNTASWSFDIAANPPADPAGAAWAEQMTLDGVVNGSTAFAEVVGDYNGTSSDFVAYLCDDEVDVCNSDSALEQGSGTDFSFEASDVSASTLRLNVTLPDVTVGGTGNVEAAISAFPSGEVPGDYSAL